MRIHRDSVFYSAAMFTFSSVALSLMGFVYRIAMSRLIGAEGMGVYGLVMPVYAVAQSFTLSGLVLAVTRKSAQYQALGNRGALRLTLRISMGLYAVLFLCAAGPLGLFSGPISAQLLGDGRTRTALLLLLPCMALTGVENLFKAYFQGTRHIVPPIVSELSEQVVRIGAVLALLYVFRGANAGVSAALIITGMIISEVSSVTILSVWHRLSKRVRQGAGQKSGTTAGRMAKELLRAAVPVSFAGLCTNLLASATSVILPRRLTGSGLAREEALKAFGVMSGMSMPLVMMPAALVYPLVAVLVPKLAQASALNDTADIKRKTAKGLHATGIISFGAAAVLLSLGEPMARLLYHEPSAGRYMAALTGAGFLTYYQIVTGGILNGIGRHKIASASILLCSLTHLLCTWVLCAVPGIGMAGYVAGDLVSALFGVCFNMAFIVRRTGLSLRVHNWVVKPLLSFFASAFSARLASSLMAGRGMGEVLGVCLGAAVCVAVYLAALRFQGVSFGRYLGSLRKGGMAAEAMALFESAQG